MQETIEEINVLYFICFIDFLLARTFTHRLIFLLIVYL